MVFVIFPAAVAGTIPRGRARSQPGTKLGLACLSRAKLAIRPRGQGAQGARSALGQGKAWGAVLWLHGHLFLGMELPVDAENEQAQSAEEEKPDLGLLLGTTLSFGEKTWGGFHQERRGQRLSAAWTGAASGLCAPNLSFVTGL